MSVKLSIIIVSYKTRDILESCLQTLQQFGWPDQEIIVVDNLSEDGTVEMIRQKFPEVKVIIPSSNLGFSLGNNEGMRGASGEYILLLNPDTEMKEGTLKKLMDYASRYPDDLIAPRLLNRDGSLQDSSWKFPMVIDSWMELFYLHTISKRNFYDLKNVRSMKSVDSVSGAAILFSKKSMEAIGGMDATMFWMEDIDFCYRFHLSGRKVYYLPEAEIMHIGGESAKKNLNKAISNQLISKLKFFKKHGSTVSFYTLSLVIFLHILSRIACFQCVHLIRPTPKAEAYRFTLKRWINYQFKNDTTI